MLWRLPSHEGNGLKCYIGQLCGEIFMFPSHEGRGLKFYDDLCWYLCGIACFRENEGIIGRFEVSTESKRFYLS